MPYRTAWLLPPGIVIAYREGSSRGPAPPSPHSSDEWNTPSPPRASVVIDVDYAKESDEERMAFEMMLR
jgi:hypothetical protein